MDNVIEFNEGKKCYNLKVMEEVYLRAGKKKVASGKYCRSASEKYTEDYFVHNEQLFKIKTLRDFDVKFIVRA